MNFQVTVLKILASYPDGFASMADLKRDMAILVTSGPEWAERTRRMAARVPNLDIFSAGLVVRENGGWRITEQGRVSLARMEVRSGTADEANEQSQHHSPIPPPALPANRVQLSADDANRRLKRLLRRRTARQRARAKSGNGRSARVDSGSVDSSSAD